MNIDFSKFDINLPTCRKVKLNSNIAEKPA